MSFADKLRWHRERAGLTRREVAEKAGVSHFTVRAWELGQSEPRHRAFNALCRLFKVPPAGLESDVAA